MQTYTLARIVLGLTGMAYAERRDRARVKREWRKRHPKQYAEAMRKWRERQRWLAVNVFRLGLRRDQLRQLCMDAGCGPIVTLWRHSEVDMYYRPAFEWMLAQQEYTRCAVCGEIGKDLTVPVLDTAGQLWRLACEVCRVFVAPAQR